MGIERRIERKIGEDVTGPVPRDFCFRLHPEKATFTNDAAFFSSPSYFQGIIENRIFPRIATFTRRKISFQFLIYRLYGNEWFFTVDFLQTLGIDIPKVSSLYTSLCSTF